MKIIVESSEKEFESLKPIIKKTAAKIGRFLRQKNIYLEIFLVGGKFMDKNVLAFPAPENFPRPDLKSKPIGEIYLNPRYIEKHGENLTFMLIHGFLHLLGYDHERKSDTIIMQKREQELLNRF